MTPERWQRIEALYHAALARPPGERVAFLAKACPDDDALRREVQFLIDEPVSGDGFLAEPAILLAARAASDVSRAPMASRSLGGYHLEALIGAGGMGEVYRAHDSKLGRDVAIKVLPAAFTSDAGRLARFEREAQMLAALNHPNVCAIYGLEQAGDVRFLILELVDGETLADRLASVARKQTDGAGLPLHDALVIARQIAEALEIAHEKGIIHRDLKPANIKITPEGVVKVLDFGLAKTVAREGSSPGLTHVPMERPGGGREGPVLGTAAYMSPEQARGLAVDKRTDIWAFGCVLFEMLSGRVVFAGDTVSDTIAKILERSPDWSALPAATPEPIRRLLRRCLEKDPKQRSRDIGDVRIELDEFDEGLQGGSAGAVASAAPAGGVTKKWLPWVAAIALAAGLAVREAGRPVATFENPFADARFTLLTNWEGTEEAAAISPDGKFVVFLSDRAGQFDLWLNQIGTDQFVNLTADYPPLDTVGILRNFGFSGDGQVWFGSPASAPQRQRLLVPMTGGVPRPFLSERSVSVSWSSDGARMAFFNDRPGDSIFVADDPTGADPRPILEAVAGRHNHNPMWSTDDQWIYYVSGFVYGLNQTDELDVWRIRPSGGAPERLTNRNSAMTFVAPLDARTVLFVARAEDRSGPWLWGLNVESKTSRRVISGLEQYTSVAASRDGQRVVATRANPTASLWRVPLGDRLVQESDVRAYPVPAPGAQTPRFGGTSLFYLSARGTGDGLFREQDGSAVEIWKGSDGALSEPPAVSRDGRRVAVILRDEGKQRLLIMSADGTDRRGLAASIDIRGTADWSPDGTSIVVGGRDASGPALFRIPLDDSQPVRLVTGEATNPIWSAAGNLIVYSEPVVAGQVSLSAVRPDGTAVGLPALRTRPGSYRFTPDGTGLVYVQRGQSLDFWRLDLATGASRPITRLESLGRLQTFDITPDGKHIVFDRSNQNSDIVLITLPK